MLLCFHATKHTQRSKANTKQQAWIYIFTRSIYDDEAAADAETDGLDDGEFLI